MVQSFLKTLIIIIATMALTAVGISGFWYWRSKKAGGDSAAATAVRLEKVRRGDLAEVIQAPGEVEPKNKVSISARVSARIIDLPHIEGSRVVKDSAETSASVLVRLDATDLQASLRSAKARHAAQQAQIKVSEARIASAKSQIRGQSIMLNDALREFRREKELMDKRNTSQQNFDQAERKTDELRSQLDAARHSVEAEEASLSASRHTLDAADAEITRAEKSLSDATIVSPIDGTVTRVNAKVGEMVIVGTMNNAGTVILDVADLSKMLIVANVDEADIGSVREGQPAAIYMQAFPDTKFKGYVETIALASKEKDKIKNFTAEVVLETNGERIPSGLTADVDIETSRHLGVLQVPSQAVLGRPYDELPEAARKLVPESERTKSMITVVFRKDTDKAHVIPVIVGQSDATHTMIKAGLKEGETIVTGPYKILETLKHDQKIKDESETTGTKTGTKDKAKEKPARKQL